MAKPTNTQSIKTQPIDEDTRISTQAEIDALNRSLGLIIPETVFTEMIPTWNKFFYLLRKMLDMGNLQDNQIPGLLATFESVPDNQKNDRMNLLSEQFNIFSRENEFIKELWYVDELSADYDDFMARFPEEVRDRYNIYLQTGEDVGDVKELIQAQLELQSADQQQRLNTVLERRAAGFRVDTNDQRGTFALSQRNGIILNEDELEERFAGQEDMGSGVTSLSHTNFGSNGGSNQNPNQNPNFNQSQLQSQPYKQPVAPVRRPLDSGNPNNSQYVTAPRPRQQPNPQNFPQQQYPSTPPNSNPRQYQNQPQNLNFRPAQVPSQRPTMPHQPMQANTQQNNQNSSPVNHSYPSTAQTQGMRPKPIANLDDLLNNKQ